LPEKTSRVCANFVTNVCRLRLKPPAGVPMERVVTQERRHNFRVRTKRAVVVYAVDAKGQVGGALPATTVDVSANGISLRLVDAAKLTGRLCVQFRFAQPALEQIVFGHTVQAPKPGVIGVRFDGVSPQLRRQLTRFVFAEAKRLGQGERPVGADAAENANAGRQKPTAPAPVVERGENPGRLTVDEFAAQIGQTVGSTRRLLNKGLVPGARRMDPTAKKSHWIIPLTAPEDYLALFRRQDAGAAAPAVLVGRP
jgi:hypothetical protein